MKRISVAALLALLVLSSTFSIPGPILAQTPAQRGNSVTVRFASPPGGSGVSLGLTYRLNPALDGTFAFDSISTFAYAPLSPFSSEFDLGLRYHVPVLVPGVDPYFGGGVSVTSVTGGTSTAGLFLQTGVSFSLASPVKWYAGLTYGSAGGVSTTSYDLGVQLQLVPLVSVSVGFAGSSARGNVYLGVGASY